MDGFQPYQPGRVVTGSRPAVLRGLPVRSFDAAPDLPDPAAEAMERAERQAMLAAARAEGEALGREAGRAEAEAAREQAVAATLHAVAGALTDAEAMARTAVDGASEALARLLLAALDAALPAASATLASETAQRLVRTLRPVLEEAQGLTLLVAPGFAADCAAAIGDARITVREDAALAPGDARAEWRGGEAAVELARQREAVAGVLRALGLEE